MNTSYNSHLFDVPITQLDYCTSTFQQIIQQKFIFTSLRLASMGEIARRSQKSSQVRSGWVESSKFEKSYFELYQLTWNRIGHKNLSHDNQS